LFLASVSLQILHEFCFKMSSMARADRRTVDEPVTIAVLGVTGAGKSTLIKSVSDDPTITVGNTLTSCACRHVCS